MPADIALSAHQVGKSYLLGHNAQIDAHLTLREQMTKAVRDLTRKTRDMVAGRQIVQGDSVEEFWAVRDVSFEVPRGARLGIVGRNGAGKSTLLKLLSRITEPTRGRIAINGRVASLLEVGTGFHPELTGRENVYLNGAILGMSRNEIQQKFDEIVAFSEVERFLDTPVKRYSSGMYMRLAFAVAAHLEPEILIVDEVLAVGDAEFQKKCLGKMKDVGAGGRTVIFVSHNLPAVTQLCDLAVHLRAGQLIDFGPTESVISGYIGDNAIGTGYREWPNTDRDDVAVLSLELLDAQGVRRTEFTVEQAFQIRMTVEVVRPQADGWLGFRIGTGDGTPVFSSEDVHAIGRAVAASPGIHVITLDIPADYLNDGSYTITVAGHIPNVRWLFMKTEAIHFQIHANDPIGAKRLGYVRPNLNWTVSSLSSG